MESRQNLLVFLCLPTISVHFRPSKSFERPFRRPLGPGANHPIRLIGFFQQVLAVGLGDADEVLAAPGFEVYVAEVGQLLGHGLCTLAALGATANATSCSGPDAPGGDAATPHELDEQRVEY